MNNPARSLIIAPRLPALKRETYTGNPFTSEGDVVLDCDVVTDGKTCGWHAYGSRADTKKAWTEHYKLYHAGSQEVGIVRLNTPRE